MAPVHLILLCCIFLAAMADQVEFLQKQSGNLLHDLEAVFGHSSLQTSVVQSRARLQSMFHSLPKNPSNRLGHATARYALHRITADLHGWRVSGLEWDTTALNTTLVGSGILSGLLPAYVENIFAAHTDTAGFSLDDIAILASTIEYLVHDDQKDILRKACEVFNLPTMSAMPEQDMKTIIKLYMAAFILSQDISHLQMRTASRLLKQMPDAYPGWDDAVMLIDDERETLVYVGRDRANPFGPRSTSFQVAMRAVERIADRFVRVEAEPECQEIKEDLLEYERGDSGRIHLADFYRAGLGTRFFFTETKEYLRAVGALDESDSQGGAKVIVSNYVLAKSNCLADTHIYSVCCVNECEGLYGYLEQGLVAPDGTPHQIASLVTNLSSSTVQAPRNLSQTLLRRLHEVAAAHGGKVLLHGRLFAQWMHQAFPRECPYPHLVGTTTSLSPRGWENQTQRNASIDKSAILSYMGEINLSLEPLDVDDFGADAMWTLEEEHFVDPTRSLAERFTASFGVIVPFICVAVAITVKAFLVGTQGMQMEKVLVV